MPVRPSPPRGQQHIRRFATRANRRFVRLLSGVALLSAMLFALPFTNAAPVAARVRPSGHVESLASARSVGSVEAMSSTVARAHASTGVIVNQSATYLALGDSVTFGYSPLLDPTYPSNFVGYPTQVGASLRYSITNIACPGTTSGYVIATDGSAGADWQCGAWRAQYPLHVAYNGSQLDEAVAFLNAHPQTKLVSVLLGFNDLYAVGEACAWDDACLQSNLPAAFTQLSANLTTIYTKLRQSMPSGARLLALTYYPMQLSASPATTPTPPRAPSDSQIQALDNVIRTAAQAAGVAVADVYPSWAHALSTYSGNACAAGLLIDLSAQNACDLHPSTQGQALIANVALRRLRY